MSDSLGGVQALADIRQNDLFRQGPARKCLVRAAAPGSREAPVVAPSLPADLADGGTADPADHRARKQFPRVMRYAAPLLCLETPLSLTAGPRASHLRDLGLRGLPEVLRDDP